MVELDNMEGQSDFHIVELDKLREVHDVQMVEIADFEEEGNHDDLHLGGLLQKDSKMDGSKVFLEDHESQVY